MCYIESKKRIEEIVNAMETNRQIENQLAASMKEIGNEINSYRIPVINMTNSEFYVLANDFLETEVYSLMQQFRESCKSGRFHGLIESPKDILDKISSPISQAKNLQTGLKAEEKVFNELKRLLPQDLIIFKNTVLNGAEHDILILSRNGFYSIEVKAHSGTMEWDGLGRYTEYSSSKQRRIINGAVDPCSQAMQHRISLVNMLKSIKDTTVSLDSIPVDSLVTVANDITVKTPPFKPQPVYGIVHTAQIIESWRNKKPALSKEHIEFLHQFVLNNKKEERTYEFYDLKSIELFFADKINLFFKLYQEYSDLCTKDSELFTELKNLDSKLSLHAGSLNSKGLRDSMEDIIRINPVPHNIIFALGIVMILGTMRMKIVLLPIVMVWSLSMCTLAFIRILVNRKKARKCYELCDQIHALLLHFVTC